MKVALRGLSVGTGDNRVELDPGTCLVALGQQTKNRARLMDTLQKASADGVRILPVSTGLTPAGIDLGSNHFATIPPAQVAMFVGNGIGAYQAGEVWHSLDTRFGIRPSMILQSQLGKIPLDRYSAMIMPSGTYSNLGDAATAKLRAWVSEGGTVICLGSASEFATHSLLGDPTENRSKGKKDDTDGKKDKPVFRGFWRGTSGMLINAILLGDQCDPPSEGGDNH